MIILSVNRIELNVKKKSLRTSKEVRTEFERRGLSISDWARAHHFSTHLVYQVLSGSKKGLRGQCHQIAVTLGLKEGLVEGLESLPFPRLPPKTRNDDIS